MILTFFTKKIKSAKSAKNFLHDKYRLTSPLFMLEQSSLYVIRRLRYSRKCDFWEILRKKKKKKL
jgi:hypothetical protein